VNALDWWYVLFSLREATEAVKGAMSEIGRDTAEDFAELSVGFGHAVTHINRAWNHCPSLAEVSDVTIEYVMAEMDSIPNWNGRLTISKTLQADCIPEWLHQCEQDETQTDTVRHYCNVAIRELTSIDETADDESSKREQDEALNRVGLAALQALSLAWHFRSYLMDDVEMLSDGELEEISNVVPQWDVGFSIVPVDTFREV
jgi:hypothetical protein